MTTQAENLTAPIYLTGGFYVCERAGEIVAFIPEFEVTMPQWGVRPSDIEFSHGITADRVTPRQLTGTRRLLIESGKPNASGAGTPWVAFESIDEARDHWRKINVDPITGRSTAESHPQVSTLPAYVIDGHEYCPDCAEELGDLGGPLSPSRLSDDAVSCHRGERCLNATRMANGRRIGALLDCKLTKAGREKVSRLGGSESAEVGAMCRYAYGVRLADGWPAHTGKPSDHLYWSPGQVQEFGHAEELDRSEWPCDPPVEFVRHMETATAMLSGQAWEKMRGAVKDPDDVRVMVSNAEPAMPDEWIDEDLSRWVKCGSIDRLRRGEVQCSCGRDADCKRCHGRGVHPTWEGWAQEYRRAEDWSLVIKGHRFDVDHDSICEPDDGMGISLEDKTAGKKWRFFISETDAEGYTRGYFDGLSADDLVGLVGAKRVIEWARGDGNLDAWIDDQAERCSETIFAGAETPDSMGHDLRVRLAEFINSHHEEIAERIGWDLPPVLMVCAE